MKRLVYIISTFLILTGMYGGNASSEYCASSTGTYLVKYNGNEYSRSLSLCLSSGGKRGLSGAEATRYYQELWEKNTKWCATKSNYRKEPPAVCRNRNGVVVDSENLAKLEFNRLNGRTTPFSTTTASSSGVLIWCVTKFTYGLSSESRCRGEGGKVYKRDSEGLKMAKAEYRYLSSLPSTTASASSSTGASTSSKGWCAHPKWVRRTSKVFCHASEGNYFESEELARNEHKNLKVFAKSGSKSHVTHYDKVWCVTNNKVEKMYQSLCGSKMGTPFTTWAQADAALKRLKGGTTPEVKTASLTIRSNVTGDKVYIDGNFKGSTRLDLKLSKGKHTIRIEKDGYKTYEESINLTDNLIIRGHLIKIVDEPVKTVVVDNTVEVEFWKSIKDSDDADMYRAYLEEYATGKFVKLAKIKLKKLGGTTTSVAKASIPNLDYGDYYALVIGNNDYELLPDLKTAVNDANKVASVLKYDYGFQVELLTDATRSDILKSLKNHRKKLGVNDNFLLYYAGHGDYDEDANKTGYWLPVDATRDDPSNWVMTDYVVNQIKAMEAKHVMVVADSCFSGELTRGIKIDYGSPSWIKKLVDKKARVALTSGDLEPVSDSGGGGKHSIFAKVFISLLEENTGVLNTTQLFSELLPKVSKNAKQTPRHGKIRYAGDDGGDFLFVRQR